jgi:hypothetical protein
LVSDPKRASSAERSENANSKQWNNKKISHNTTWTNGARKADLFPYEMFQTTTFSTFPLTRWLVVTKDYRRKKKKK